MLKITPLILTYERRRRLFTKIPANLVFQACISFYIGDRKGTTKKLCDQDFAERSGELSGAICLKTLVYWVVTGNPPELSSTAGDASFFRIGSGEGLSELVMEFPAVLGVFLILGAVRAIFWLCGSFLAPDKRCFEILGPPIRKILGQTGMLLCLAPSWPQTMQICISF